MIQKGFLQKVPTAVTVAKSLILILVYDSRFETSFFKYTNYRTGFIATIQLLSHKPFCCLQIRTKIKYEGGFNMENGRNVIAKKNVY